ncbi:MAG TPA: hypothetical protein VKW76_14530 [Candidatus Binatia bacterium]|nr:hypothetical protein [Candidatus Binatia bacterium]
MRLTAAALLVALALPAGAATTYISWDEAEQHVGQDVVVKGRVLGVHCSPTSCLLAFEPTFNRFTAVVEAKSFDAFPPDRLDDLFSGKLVEVHGTITQNDRKPEIVVAGPADLKVASPESKDEGGEGAQAHATDAEIVARLADVLERIEALTERMAATQERMDALLAQLEQRSAALAAAEQPVTPAPQPSYGVPQPRPAYEALRTVKRGMTVAEVERLIGQPSYVEAGGGGWVTWYYGFGRSISFDERGRAQSMVGFPAP